MSLLLDEPKVMPMPDSDQLPADLAASAIAHMNADHAQNLRDYARALLGLSWAERAVITQIDCAGFELVASAGAREEAARIAFDQPVTDGQQLRKAMVLLAQRALEQLAPQENEHNEQV